MNEPGIEQEIDPLARRELAPLVLFLDALFATAEKRARIVQLIQTQQVGRRGAGGGMASVGHDRDRV